MSGAGCVLPIVLLAAGLAVAMVWHPLAGIAIAAGGLGVAAAALKRSAAAERKAGGDEQRRFEAIAPASGAAWRTLLGAERIPGDVVNDVAPLVRPAIRITVRRADRVAAGASRVGGVPDLPSGLEWPRRNARPLTFLAQINLEEVAPLLPAGPLPADGYLWFFYDTKEQPWGFDPAHADGSRVLHTARQTLAAVTPPAALHEAFPLCGVEMEAYDDIPDLEPDDPLGRRLGEAALERYAAVRNYLRYGARESAHKLLGYADPVQGPMELECEMVSAGLSVGNGYPDTGDRAAALAAGARSWRLLLQIESDDEASMMWGDAGSLYFWIRVEDLEARRFDRARLILQCH